MGSLINEVPLYHVSVSCVTTQHGPSLFLRICALTARTVWSFRHKLLIRIGSLECNKTVELPLRECHVTYQRYHFSGPCKF